MTQSWYRFAAVRWLLACLVLSVVPAFAQPKPIGAFSSEGAPDWVTFGALSGDASPAQMEAAASRSRATGFRWVLQLGYSALPLQPAEHGAAWGVYNAKASGLWPYVIAVTYGEEWHERFYANEFAALGFPATRQDGPEQVRAWMSRQHCALKAYSVGTVPIAWITGAVTAVRAVPDCTDVVAVEAYVPDGATFASLEPVLAEAEAATTLPLVIIPRWFRMTGPFQGPGWETAKHAPTKDMVDGAVRVLQRPRWIALWGFLWGSRPTADLTGLADMPQVRRWLETALGVR